MHCVAKKCILLSAKTIRIYINCQGLQRQTFFTKIIQFKIKWPVKLSLNSSITNLTKSFSCYLRITSIQAEGQDCFRGRFSYVQTFVMRHSFKSFIRPLVSSRFFPFSVTCSTTFLSLAAIKYVVKINKTEMHQLLQSMAA